MTVLARGLRPRTVLARGLRPRTVLATEQEVARDLVRRALPLVPVAVLVSAAVAGVDGAMSASYAVALVCVNFLASAALITWASRISLPALMGVTLAGYVLRLGLLLVAFVAVRGAAWFHESSFGLTLVVAHLGLLAWETRHISASLAFPGLKPAATKD